MAEKKHIYHASSEPKADVMRMAQEIRKLTNSLSDDSRAAALERGMQLIYGGSSHVTAQTGRA